MKHKDILECHKRMAYLLVSGRELVDTAAYLFDRKKHRTKQAGFRSAEAVSSSACCRQSWPRCRRSSMRCDSSRGILQFAGRSSLGRIESDYGQVLAL